MAKPSQPPAGGAPTGGSPAQVEIPPLLLNHDIAETLPQPSRLPSKRPAKPLERAYLVVFEENTALTYELPATGEVIVGRAPEVALQLTDLSALSARALAGARR